MEVSAIVKEGRGFVALNRTAMPCRIISYQPFATHKLSKSNIYDGLTSFHPGYLKDQLRDFAAVDFFGYGLAEAGGLLF